MVVPLPHNVESESHVFIIRIQSLSRTVRREPFVLAKGYGGDLVVEGAQKPIYYVSYWRYPIGSTIS